MNLAGKIKVYRLIMMGYTRGRKVLREEVGTVEELNGGFLLFKGVSEKEWEALKEAVKLVEGGLDEPIGTVIWKARVTWSRFKSDEDLELELVSSPEAKASYLDFTLGYLKKEETFIAHKSYLEVLSLYKEDSDPNIPPEVRSLKDILPPEQFRLLERFFLPFPPSMEE